MQFDHHNIDRRLRNLLMVGTTVGAVTFAGVLPANASATPKMTLTTLTLVIPGQFGGSSAVYWYGLQRGIFRKYGINLQISDPTSASTTSIGTYLQQGLYDIGTVAPTNVILGDTNDQQTVESFFGYIQASETCLMVPISSGITKPQQLAGKIIGIANTAAPAQYIAYLKSYGVYNAADITSTGTSANTALYLTGKETAIGGYGYNLALYSADGVPSRALYLAKAGINEMTQAIGATKSFISSHKRLLHEFTLAMAASMRATNANPKAAAAADQAGNPTQPNQVGLLTQEINLLKPFLQTKNDKGHPYGWMSRVDMAGQKVDDERFSSLSPTANLAATWTNDIVNG